MNAFHAYERAPSLLESMEDSAQFILDAFKAPKSPPPARMEKYAKGKSKWVAVKEPPQVADARMLLYHVASVRAFMDDGDTNAAICHAFAMGRVHHELQTRWDVAKAEQETLNRKKGASAAAAKSKRAALKLKDKIIDAAKRQKNLVGGFRMIRSRNEFCTKIAAQFDTSLRTVQSALKDFWPRKSSAKR